MNTVRIHNYTISKILANHMANMILTEFAIIICTITKSINKIGV